MADREGLLTGPGLSPVQHFAVVLLEYLDRVEKTKEQWEREDRELRLGLMMAGHMSPVDAFPELRRKDESEDEVFPDETEAVTYVFPEQEFDQQSIEEELRTLAAQAAQGYSSFDNDTTREW